MTQTNASETLASATGVCVLVVDDHEDSLEMMAEYLRLLVGCRVETATTGVEALAAVEAMHPAVVLMDLQLPGHIDGWEVTRTIKAHPVLKEARVIAVTGHAFPPDLERAMRAGCDAVVLKPVDLPALARQVAQVAALHRAKGTM
jgi:two-component system cell cycle response regulator DivK